jgi:hypothetical protein
VRHDRIDFSCADASAAARGATNLRRNAVFLKEKSTGDLVEVLALSDLIDPYNKSLVGRYHHGEETQDPELFAKQDLVFPSGEALPSCWTDPNYRSTEVQRRPRA